MSEPGRDELRAAWRQQARRYDWALVDDEEQFLDLAVEALGRVSATVVPSKRLRIALWCAYSVLLYRGMWRRQERAAQELWQAFIRTALRDKSSMSEAEELAQETIAVVLEKLHTVKTPQGFLTWAFKVFRTVRRDSRKRASVEQPLQNNEGEFVYEPVDSANLALDVEQNLISQELQALLRVRHEYIAILSYPAYRYNSPGCSR